MTTNQKTDPSQLESQAELIAQIVSRLNNGQQTPRSETAPKNPALTINIIELFYFFLSKLHYLVIGMVLGGIALGFYASIQTPIYSATSKLYLIGSTGISVITDLQIGTQMTMDYQEVFKTWEVHQMVNEELGTSYPYSVLQGMISVGNPESTRVLYITARNPDSQMAADIANAYANAAKKFIVETMKTDEPSSFSVALVPGVASKASVTGYIIRGILLGTVLVGGILLLIFLLDNRPKSPEDIARYAGIPTLAVIPRSSEFSGKDKTRKAGKS